MKRVVLMGDPHCGHYTGLTPPNWMIAKARSPKARAVEEETWKRYRDLAKEFNPVDVVVCNGDLIEGKGVRSGGTELLEADMNKQAEMCVEVLDQWKTKKYFLTYGTPYHTTSGSGEDMEKLVAQKMDCPISGHMFVEVDGVVFDCKHKVLASQIPWMRHAAVSRERSQNLFWNEMEESQPKADIVVRSHVHYFGYCGGFNWMGVTLPGLQGPTKFGARQCSGTIHWGLVVVDVEKGRVVGWEPRVVALKEMKVEVLKA